MFNRFALYYNEGPDLGKVVTFELSGRSIDPANTTPAWIQGWFDCHPFELLLATMDEEYNAGLIGEETDAEFMGLVSEGIDGPYLTAADALDAAKDFRDALVSVGVTCGPDQVLTIEDYEALFS